MLNVRQRKSFRSRLKDSSLGSNDILNHDLKKSQPEKRPEMTNGDKAPTNSKTKENRKNKSNIENKKRPNIILMMADDQVRKFTKLLEKIVIIKL